MKRLIQLIILLSLVAIVFTNCDRIFMFEKYGLENFGFADCSYSTTSNLFPDKSFISKFPYEDGYYHYLEPGNMAGGYATACAYLEYTEDDYMLAKEYCLENFSFCEAHNTELNGYVFMTLQEDSEIFISEEHRACGRSKKFNLFAYNDERCILVFLGYFNGDSDSSERALLDSNFPEFLKSAFSKDYDFSPS